MKEITEIVPQKNNKKRCNVYLNGEFFCGLELFTVMKNRLKVGVKLTENQLKEMILEDETETALNKALTYVSKYMRTKSQVVKYLKSKQFLPETITVVTAKLEGYGFVNDESFARAYIDQKKLSKGKRALAFELKMKGVDSKAIDIALTDAPSEEEGALLIAKKFFSGKDITFENVQKCYRRLLSRGFDYDIAKWAVDKIKNENENY